MNRKAIPTNPFFTDMMQKYKENADDLNGTIQFDVTGEDGGQHYVQFADGKATYHHGVAEHSDITIHMPADIWHKVRHGDAEGIRSLMDGQCTIDGDFALLKQMRQIFSE